jgi:multiple sugar transport system substrate-binding protein
MTRHLHRSLTIFLLTGLVLSGCIPVAPTLPANFTPSDQGEISVPTDTTTPTQVATNSVSPSDLHAVNIEIWHAFSGGAGTLLDNQVALFNSTNEWGIVVTATGFGDYQALFDSVNKSLVSGVTPDIVSGLPEQTLSLDASSYVVDLNPYIMNPVWGLNSNDIADFPSVFWSQDKLNGRQLGVPAQRSARYLYYNQTWAHQLGFSHPPATADEFRQQACAANASFRANADPQDDGYGGWIVDTSWQTIYSWLLSFGGAVADGSLYTFRTDPNLAALKFLKSLYDDHCAWLSTDQTPFDSFARRSALFISADLAEVPLAIESMSRLHNNDEWTLLPFPGLTSSVVVPYGPSYSLLKSTAEKQMASWLFTRWLLQAQNQAQWVEASGLYPLRTSVMDEIGPYRTASPQWVQAVNDLSMAQGVPQLASWRKVRYVLQDGATVIFRMNTPLDKLPSVLSEMDSMTGELGK